MEVEGERVGADRSEGERPGTAESAHFSESLLGGFRVGIVDVVMVRGLVREGTCLVWGMLDTRIVIMVGR